ncbi:MAG: SdrD B-like domain-containing protein [Tepidisphaeraceae bacterium]
MPSWSSRVVSRSVRPTHIKLRQSMETLDRRMMLDGDPTLPTDPIAPEASLPGISGSVFVDTNKNGVKDGAETGLSGVSVTFDMGPDNVVEWTATTDSNGAYAISEIPAGQTYRVRIVTPAGYALTTADPADLANVTSAVTGPDFGLTQQQTVLSGRVFEDLNGNAVVDGMESGIANQVVFLDANNNQALDAGETSVLTDSKGEYTFVVDTGGTYSIRVIATSGYVQTTPLLSPVLANTPGGTQDIPDVGVHLIPKGGTLTGFVFGDSNGNGVQDAGETGLAGVTVYTDQNENGIFDANVEVSVVTDATGTYKFTFTEDDEYLLKLQLPAGQTQTTPNPAGAIVALGWDVKGGTFGVRTQPPAPPTISIADNSITEGNSGQKNLVFTVTRIGDLSKASSFNYRVLSGTAVPTSDYVASHLPTTVNFAANQSTATIAIPIRGDIQVETNENFFVQLESPVNATITRAKATGVIINDDTQPSGTSVVPDICDPTKTSAKIDGTVGADKIEITAGASQGIVRVKINGVDKGLLNFTGSIVIWGHAGNDTITIAPAITRTVVVFAGDGNDTVTSAAGNDVVVLGEGNDYAYGGGGRDLLIGQNGEDRLDGQSGDDILIGGTTTLDDNAASLCAIMKEWTRTDRTYTQRVAAIQNGGGLNGSTKLNKTNVLSGGTPPDTLTGGLGQDFFFALLPRAGAVGFDTIKDKAADETVVLL